MTPEPIPPAPGQESVWSFPRPAIAEPSSARIVIEHRGVVLADTRASIRTLETSHPPSYYIPRADILESALRRGAGSSFCEWKGAATYWDVVLDGETLPSVGWSYPSPTRARLPPARRLRHRRPNARTRRAAPCARWARIFRENRDRRSCRRLHQNRLPGTPLNGPAKAEVIHPP